ncbi:hypothetical protein WDZ16_14260 [Pseudokineococcus marinus]|uniref:Uncharacterized protein n=1 Tax=Pseudokineococcus marinus TaxID=351215 RepID=A0A849BJR9_9ACTN|nr:hypothetical protein [Pseudokineococcus marinus]NNH23440.1 hypothetical protein [Pseudokineococcus marinus]
MAAPGPPRDELDEPAGEPRRQGAHRARPGPWRRAAPVLVVVVLAALSVLAVSAWFSLGG